jgi:hypothetical protein
MNSWVRKSFVTKGADPTEIVEWSFTSEDGTTLTIQEFQNVYSCTNSNAIEQVLDEEASRKVHQLLEADWQKDQEYQESLHCEHGYDWGRCCDRPKNDVCEHGYAVGCRACDPDGGL